MIRQHKPSDRSTQGDICLLLEGTYPYVRGGVSSWTHELIASHPDYRFHIVCLLPGRKAPPLVFDLPDNVLSVTDVFLGVMPNESGKPPRNLMRRMEPLLRRMASGAAGLSDFTELTALLRSEKGILSEDYLLNSRDAWQVIESMYETDYAQSSMLDYFWSWRALFGSVFSVMLAPLPNAKLYHALCTGYAGLLAARARTETNAPVLLTEHGIYTNERRIEIASADWLEETAGAQLTIDPLHSDLRDLWIHAFGSYSRICYEACDEIVTLFAGNQLAQLADGADSGKMRVIPNGVDVARYGAIVRQQHAVPTIALIGRVVPIKDVKSFIRACALIRETLGELKAYIMGNTEEEPEYVAECRALAEHLLLEDVVQFTGAVRIDDYLPTIDVVVFTSISEAQPLVILEAGAAGIPVVSTNVGACDEMINGAQGEFPPLGNGGAVVPLANPSAVAAATVRLLTDEAWYESCSNALRQRVERYYTKAQQQQAYGDLYASLLES